MKILHITLGFYPARAWGGPITVVYQVASELRRRGHRLAVCASNRLDKREYIAPGSFERSVDGFRVVYLNTRMVQNWPGTVGPTWLGPEGMRRLWAEVRAADIVHAHGTRNALVMIGALFCRLQRKPLVVQPHGTVPQVVSSVRLKQAFDWLFMGWLLKSADAIVALQEPEQQQITQAGGTPSKIHLVPNAMLSASRDVAECRGQFRARFGLSQSQRIVLFLGRINRKKGADLLVRAYARLPAQERRSIQLVVAGPDDGHLEEVKALVQRYDLGDRVLFTGLLTGDEVRAAYADADLFVLPCRGDTFPMVILEACDAGLPVLVTDACEISGMLHGKAAEVVPVDIDALAAGIQRVLEDTDLRGRYQRGGRDLVETEFSIQAAVDRIESIYASVSK